MRRFTLITIIVLSVLIAGAALYHLSLAKRDRELFPGPARGTPTPSVAPSS